MLSTEDIMQLIQSLIWLLAGVGVFIVGMNFMSDSLEKSAGYDFLANTAVNLEFHPIAFLENLRYMGIGMLVIFVVIGIIILATKLVNYLFSE